MIDEARKRQIIAKVNRVEAALEGERHGIAKERERIRQLALAGTDWLEPADLVPPRPSSREGDLWRRAQAVARRELAEELWK